MSSPATNQSYHHGYSNSSGSTHTGGQGTSNGYMLGQWATTQNPTESFYVTGQKTGRSAMKGMDATLDFDRTFYRTN